jgi:flagellar export protein FliJ
MQRIALISRRDERSAAESLSSMQQELDRFRKQLGELLSYREEYRRSLRCDSAMPMNGAEAQKIRAFIQQVDGVLDGLQMKIRQIEHRQTLARDAWVVSQQRANALDGVAGREQKLERNLEETRLQREIDDRVPIKRR